MQTPPDPSSPVYLLFTLLFFFGALIWLYNLTRPRVIHGTRGGIDSGFERVIETEFTRPTPRGMHDMFNNYGDQDASGADIQLPGDASSMFNNRGQRKQNLRQIKIKSGVSNQKKNSEGESNGKENPVGESSKKMNSNSESSEKVNPIDESSEKANPIGESSKKMNPEGESCETANPEQSPSYIAQKRIARFSSGKTNPKGESSRKANQEGESSEKENQEIEVVVPCYTS